MRQSACIYLAPVPKLLETQLKLRSMIQFCQYGLDTLQSGWKKLKLKDKFAITSMIFVKRSSAAAHVMFYCPSRFYLL